MHLIVVGAGGNIGSHLLPHLARMEGVARLTLVDPDVYEQHNLAGQAISAADVGRPKVRVQARRVRRIHPALATQVIQQPVESIPRGRLRCDLLVTCVDSRRTRQVVNEVALHLGIPWIDAGVDPAAGLARVSAYRAGEDAPCLECAWDARDYAAVEQRYPCAGATSGAPTTHGTAPLGGLAAAYQALACGRVVAGAVSEGDFGRQVLWDALHHKVHVTTFRREARCGLRDHAPWQLWPLDDSPRALTVEGLLALMPSTAEAEARWLQVAGSPFVTRLCCPGCGRERGLLHLRVSLRPKQLACRGCGTPCIAPGIALRDRLLAHELPPRVLALPLQRIGVRPGEIITVGGASGVAHFEIRGEGV